MQASQIFCTTSSYESAVQGQAVLCRKQEYVVLWCSQQKFAWVCSSLVVQPRREQERIIKLAKKADITVVSLPLVNEGTQVHCFWAGQHDTALWRVAWHLCHTWDELVHVLSCMMQHSHYSLTVRSCLQHPDAKLMPPSAVPC